MWKPSFSQTKSNLCVHQTVPMTIFQLLHILMSLNVFSWLQFTTAIFAHISSVNYKFKASHTVLAWLYWVDWFGSIGHSLAQVHIAVFTEPYHTKSRYHASVNIVLIWRHFCEVWGFLPKYITQKPASQLFYNSLSLLVRHSQAPWSLIYSCHCTVWL